VCWAGYDAPWLHSVDDLSACFGGAQTARQHLRLALEAAEAEGSSVTEWEIAEHHYKLGRVLWAMGDGPQKEVWAH
jgi:hypothetical protein